MILISLSYSDHVAYISFIFLLPSFRFTFCHAIHPLSFAWQSFARFRPGPSPLYLNAKTATNDDNSADDAMKEKNVKREVLKETKDFFGRAELFCCRVDGEK